MSARYSAPAPNAFVPPLLRWFAAVGRPLPWRTDYHPYRVWISEIMLQQTQLERGVRYFSQWMQRFPTIHSVAKASQEDILSAWEGLGYYSRARNLHAAAQHIVREYGGVFPEAAAAIRSLPGVGEYTAAAIRAIAFNQPVAAVDANVLRIFTRLCDIDLPPAHKAVRAFIAGAVQALVPDDSPRRFAEALMELGESVCRKVPRCDVCPVAASCLARQAGRENSRPAVTPKPQAKRLEIAAGIVLRHGRILVRKRPAGGLWPGLWEFPSGPVEAGDDPAAAARRHAENAGAPILPPGSGKKIATVRHGYTVHRVVLHGFLFEIPGTADVASTNADAQWLTADAASRLAFPAGQRKLLESLGWKGKRQPG